MGFSRALGQNKYNTRTHKYHVAMNWFIVLAIAALITAPLNTRAFSIAESGVVNTDKSTLSAAFVAKRNLREALESNNFSSKAKPVQDAVDELARFNPTKGDPISSSLFFGNWQALTSPTYPGRIEGTPDDVYKFTLGRMSFNMFQPKGLVCTLGTTMNPVEPSSSDCSDDDWSERQSFSYSTETAITVATKCGVEIPAILIADATCRKSSQKGKENRVEVMFCGGSLKQRGEIGKENANLWAKTFTGAYLEADKTRSRRFRLLRRVLRWAFRVTPPSDESPYKYELGRPLKGWLDILYLDDELRVTRGNAGSIVIAERT